jgi:hypothetical protein
MAQVWPGSTAARKNTLALQKNRQHGLPVRLCEGAVAPAAEAGLESGSKEEGEIFIDDARAMSKGNSSCCSSDRIASVATRTCRRSRPTLGYAHSNARSVRRAPRSCTGCAPIAAVSSPPGRDGPRPCLRAGLPLPSGFSSRQAADEGDRDPVNTDT